MCGVSLIRADALGNLKWAAQMNLPGPRQTVPRAEYFGFNYLCERAEENSVIEYVTDHLPLKKAFEGGVHAAQKVLNWDLMVPAFSAIHRKSLTVTMRWMPSWGL